jgi:isopenicillin N synthase-like dioxygenase
MERYYDQPDEVKALDSRPDLHFQVGSTPEGNEYPRDNIDYIQSLKDEQKPHMPKDYDHKWRFFWRAGEWPQNTKFKELNAEKVIPKGFDTWEKDMDGWAKKMLDAVVSVCQMFCIGLKWPKDTLTKLMHQAPHLLAPTGTNLEKYHNEGDIMAGFHYDLSFVTIHGRTRFPGLFAWLRNGTKFAVKTPDGHLLLQSGKQLEWLTGGYCRAGFHEVVVSKDTIEAFKKAKEQGRCVWRVSTTLFSHIASDVTLKPLMEFSTEENRERYPDTLAGDQVLQELQKIGLAKKK